MTAENLLQDRRFLPLFLTQLFGCFSDALLKTAFIMLVTYSSTSVYSDFLVSLANLVLIFPFIALGSIAGEVADKYEKSKLIKIIKFIEILIVLFAIICFTTKSIALLLFSIALMGVHSTMFGPLKFSILPEHLKKSELVVANAYIEASTFIGILIGTMIGGFYNLYPSFVLTTLLCSATSGFIASQYILKTKILNDKLAINFNVIKGTSNILKYSYYKKNIFLSILGISWFWVIGTMFLVQMPILCKEFLLASETIANIFFILFSVGIALGSLAYSKICVNYKISHSIILLGLIALVGIDLYLALNDDYYKYLGKVQNLQEFLRYSNNLRISFDLFCISALAGSFALPLYANIQNFSPSHYRSRIIAANNIMNSLFIITAILSIMLLRYLNFSVVSILLFGCLINFLVAFYIFKLNSPKRFFRNKIVKKIIKSILKLLYKVEVRGIENFHNAKNKTIIVANHFSYIDPPLISTYLSENIIFGIYTAFHKAWWMQPFLKIVKTIPIDQYNSFGIKNLIKLANENHKIGIFPEGKISTTGNLMKIYAGPAIIAAKTSSKILPVIISGANKTHFSKWKLQRLRLFPKITITVFPAMNLLDIARDNERHSLTKALSKIMYETIIKAHYDDNSCNLIDALDMALSNHGSRHLILQSYNKKLTYGTLNERIYKLQFDLAKKANHFIAIIIDNSIDSIILFLTLEKIGCKILLLDMNLENSAIIEYCQKMKVSTLIIADEVYKKLDNNFKSLESLGLDIVKLSSISKDKKYYSNSMPSLLNKNSNEARYFLLNDDKILGFSWSDIKLAINIFRVKYSFSYQDITFHNIGLHEYYGLVYATILPLISGIRIYSHNYIGKQSLVAEVIYDIGPTLIFSTNEQLTNYMTSSENYDFYRISVIFIYNLNNEVKEKWQQNYSANILNMLSISDGIVIAANNHVDYHRDSLGNLLSYFQLNEDNEIVGPKLISSILHKNNEIEYPQNYKVKLHSNIRILENGNLFLSH